MNLENVKKIIEENQIKTTDLKYSDLIGNWYHISFPVRKLEYVIKNGVIYDANSLDEIAPVQKKAEIFHWQTKKPQNLPGVKQ